MVAALPLYAVSPDSSLVFFLLHRFLLSMGQISASRRAPGLRSGSLQYSFPGHRAHGFQYLSYADVSFTVFPALNL